MAQKTKEALGVESLTVLADAGYFESHQLKQCQDSNINVYVPEPDRNKARASQGLFSREDFIFDADKNVYSCPNDEDLSPQGSPFLKNNKYYQRYASKRKQCGNCPLKHRCLGAKSSIKTLSRWEFEPVLEQHGGHPARKLRHHARIVPQSVQHHVARNDAKWR